MAAGYSRAVLAALTHPAPRGRIGPLATPLTSELRRESPPADRPMMSDLLRAEQREDVVQTLSPSWWPRRARPGANEDARRSIRLLSRIEQRAARLGVARGALGPSAALIAEQIADLHALPARPLAWDLLQRYALLERDVLASGPSNADEGVASHLARLALARCGEAVLETIDPDAWRRARADAEAAMLGALQELVVAEGWLRGYRAEAEPLPLRDPERLALTAQARVLDAALEARAAQEALSEVTARVGRRPLAAVGRVPGRDAMDAYIREALDVAAGALTDFQADYDLCPPFVERLLRHTPVAALRWVHAMLLLDGESGEAAPVREP
jgi:hypothetical protein